MKISEFFLFFSFETSLEMVLGLNTCWKVTARDGVQSCTDWIEWNHKMSASRTPSCWDNPTTFLFPRNLDGRVLGRKQSSTYMSLAHPTRAAALPILAPRATTLLCFTSYTIFKLVDLSFMHQTKIVFYCTVWMNLQQQQKKVKLKNHHKDNLIAFTLIVWAQLQSPRTSHLLFGLAPKPERLPCLASVW